MDKKDNTNNQPSAEVLEEPTRKVVEGKDTEIRTSNEQDEKDDKDTIPMPPPAKLMQMLGVLHQKGYGLLRGYFQMSPSGMHWRMLIITKSNCIGDSPLEYDWSWKYSTGQGPSFGKIGNNSNTAEELADKFIALRNADGCDSSEMHDKLLREGKGSDPAYEAWYADILKEMEKLKWREFPVQVADGMYYDSTNYLPTSKGTLLQKPPQVVCKTDFPTYEKAVMLAKNGMWKQLFALLEENKDTYPDLCNCTNPHSTKNFSLLHQAAWWGSELGIEGLLTRGANKRAKTASGATPLDICMQRFPKKTHLHNLLE